MLFVKRGYHAVFSAIYHGGTWRSRLGRLPLVRKVEYSNPNADTVIVNKDSDSSNAKGLSIINS